MSFTCVALQCGRAPCVRSRDPAGDLAASRRRRSTELERELHVRLHRAPGEQRRLLELERERALSPEQLEKRARRGEAGHHFGAAAYHLAPMAHAGLIGFAFTNSPAAINAWGGKRPFFGTNPIAAVFPRRDKTPIVIDLSLTATINDSLKLGKAVLSELGDINTLHKQSVEQAAFAGLEAGGLVRWWLAHSWLWLALLVSLWTLGGFAASLTGARRRSAGRRTCCPCSRRRGSPSRATGPRRGASTTARSD